MSTKSSVTSRSDEMLAHVCQGLQESLRHMPECAYRDYWAWILSSAKPAHREAWLQVSGVSGIIRLYTTMFGRLLADHELAQLAPHCTPLIVQQTYEVISDNLTIGLAQRAEQDATFELRREVVSRFNHAVIETLRGRSGSAADLLSASRPAANRLSLFEQSHSPHKHRELARAFVGAHDGTALDDLEHDVWPALVAGCAATQRLSEGVSEIPVGTIVREGLIGRYQSVHALLVEPDMDLARRLEIGTETILVQPTLAFLAGVIAERVRPMDGLPEIIQDGTLVPALEDTALLVRLLNDVGTDILLASDEGLRDRMNALRSIARRSPHGTLRDALLEGVAELGPSFTRIRKDLVLREFNVCLDEISRPAADALHGFGHALDQVRRLYHERWAELRRKLDEISNRLGDPLVSNMMTGFVKFHAALYLNDHEAVQGEFAV
jgi:hypothetical protein